MSQTSGLRVHITGIVQGVGFRPFVYQVATRLGLNGWVRNTSAGVDIEVDGTEDQLDEFVRALENDRPPLARLDSVQVDRCPANGFSSFEIVHSEPIPGAFIPISPDVSICEDCLREMLNPSDRRYLYPFINCTNCGPRFTIIEDIPYDRPNTTMAPFEMCPACRAEYEDPLDRRFHAQPVACPDCGPNVWLELGGRGVGDRENESQPLPPNSQLVSRDAILETQRLLANGEILAIKGLGGFHLACDATNTEAVAELRYRKLRVDKPFALMMPDIETIEQHCYVSKAEGELLLSRERPIVLLDRKTESNIVIAVAPNQKTLGVMLPYTPLHYLLFSGEQIADSRELPANRYPLSALVMTSGNLSEEPIAYTNDEARERLNSLADAFLLHNRDIRTRCDDSVVRQSVTTSDVQTPQRTDTYFLRRARGYTPIPIKLPWNDVPQILATGPELKNTFCLTKGNYAFLSHHIGDMENYETLRSFEDGIEHFERLFRVTPEIIAYDLHPDYLATRYALERAERLTFERINVRTFGVQHHHAHIAACMADNGLTGERPVIGVSFDGTGYGSDGAIWGGEFFIADYRGYQRFAHLEYAPLPGGDAATRKPYRAALAQLWQNGIDWDEDLPPVVVACGDDMTLLHSMLENNINCPPTSSMGRLFDAVAALVGVRGEVNYEAQAAIEFEALADPHEKAAYPFDFDGISLKAGPVLQSVIADWRAGIAVSAISARFHNGLAHSILEVCQAAKKQYGLDKVALSGGVWQNITLLRKTIPLLENDGFTVYIHRQVPTNDGGLALGQAVIASKQQVER
jgi:hydrogenase maturation protein HypF